MRAFVDRIKAMEGKDGILSISIVHCFPYADVPELTGRVLVVADGDKAEGRRARDNSSARSWSRCAARPCRSSSDVEGGVAAALGVQRPRRW